MIPAAARQAQSRASTSSIRPDLDRRREMLEGYPLDQLKMVGTLRQAGNQVALIDAAGQIHGPARQLHGPKLWIGHQDF